ncbi:diguanylate cyclase domain-containing protein [Aliivibrio kagoshimensis]|uniref:diguanylate cyclase domain-containing protein n=1 Tax=Aliivibrio kagoshimensis TaxID=2910230 RepID=UPI003D118331
MLRDKRINVSIVLVTLLGMTLSSISGWLLFRAENRAIYHEFTSDVDQRATSLHTSVYNNLETLYAMAVLFHTDYKRQLSHFTHESRNILQRHPEIAGFEWIPKDRVNDNSDHSYRAPSLFSTMQNTPNPDELQLASSLLNQVHFTQTMRSTRPFVSQGIKIQSHETSTIGFLGVFPVYVTNHLNEKLRFENSIGCLVGIFHINKIFDSSALSPTPLGINMKLVDTTKSTFQVLHNHISRTGGEISSTFSYTSTLPSIWEREWSIEASPTTGYIQSRRTILPMAIIGIGFAFTFLLALYISKILHQAVNVKQLVIEQTQQLHVANKKLQTLSRTDGLTGISNRRYLDEVLSREWRRAVRNNSYIAFILMDVDKFKAFNDHYGHIAGDECLQKIANKLSGMIHRSGDLAARYGGEEFALVLTETENALPVAQACRKSIEQLAIPHQKSEISNVVTISAGVCVCAPKQGSDPSLIIAAADKALYKAKLAGRNRVEMVAIDHGNAVKKVSY